MEFKIGDVVILKSGSPKMTITDCGSNMYGSSDNVRCVWFDGTTRCEGTFQKDTLVICEN